MKAHEPESVSLISEDPQGLRASVQWGDENAAASFCRGRSVVASLWALMSQEERWEVAWGTCVLHTHTFKFPSP